MCDMRKKLLHCKQITKYCLSREIDRSWEKQKLNSKMTEICYRCNDGQVAGQRNVKITM